MRSTVGHDPGRKGQFPRHGLHQLPLLQGSVNLNPDTQDLWEVANIGIDFVQFGIRIQEHSEFDVSVGGRQGHLFVLSGEAQLLAKHLFIDSVDADELGFRGLSRALS